ncbi:AAA family ATPase [Candidatus Uhrbacteria bacterium]|nr:AAA family ATPase [Candidatus Uhrbacteria bacterium]
MHLERLEIQGFKTFAKKTILTFLPPKGGRFPVTAIVGPNGSGKSNSADAIRWVLGEQSLKLLRGKQSDDVIFSGAEGKARAGFAEVTLQLNNEDKSMPIEYENIVITRRLYRDGTSEYLLNESHVRLIDIQLLLAQANVGQRSYSVIGQGMVDHILVSTPEERKQFFDDATGVKQFQIKRHEAMLKLNRTLENLADAEMVLQEIEPRLRSLKRQASRLEKREEVETQLHALEQTYYGNLWWQLVDDMSERKLTVSEVNKKIKTIEKELSDLEKKMVEIEKSETADDGLRALQKTYREIQHKLGQARHTQFEAEKEIELAKIKAQSNWAPLPLIKIIEGIEEIKKKLSFLSSRAKSRDLESFEQLAKIADETFTFSNKLVSQLQRPNATDMKPDPKLVAKLSNLKQEEEKLSKELARIEKEIDSYAQKEKKARTELIETQRSLRAKQQDLHPLEQERNQSEIELARIEERQQGLIREMDEFIKERAVNLRNQRVKPDKQTEDAYPEIQRLRYKLELIGGIDPEVMKEYTEIQERFDFLNTHVTDLRLAMHSTEKIIKELDEKIEQQSKKIFGEINKKFQHYFKILFGGGSCSLVKVIHSVVSNEEGTADQVDRSLGKPEMTQQEGVEIQATPPGKRLKALNLLSGGERALTSIALLSAIMDVNPSPFVVLDEVDAALDEANTIRFAAILDELSQKSQFIIITHNRATMEKADVLYGVTMGDDGISNLLSVHLEDLAKNGTARR